MAQATFKITLVETLILKIWTSVKVKVARLCLILCDPMDYTIHEILQARIVDWVAFPFSRGSSLPRDGTQVPHCMQSLCQVSHQGSPWTSVPDCKMLPGDADVQLEVGASSWTHTR